MSPEYFSPSFKGYRDNKTSQYILTIRNKELTNLLKLLTQTLKETPFQKLLPKLKDLSIT